MKRGEVWWADLGAYRPRVETYGKLAVFLDLEGNRWDLLGPDPRIRTGTITGAMPNERS